MGESDSPGAEEQVEVSLLDITYPYYNKSMLSKSVFYGFEVLLFMSAVFFCIGYTLINILNRGQPFQPNVLALIASNLVWDAAAMLLLLALGTVQIRLAIVLGKRLSIQLMSVYCTFWLVGLVGLGLWLINSIDFYFTDRIFIVVVSWALSAKTGSFCLHQLPSQPDYQELHEIESALSKRRGGRAFVILKFIVSPQIVYGSFLRHHRPSLPIHLSYLLIKGLVALGCLLINYLLVTETIDPLLDPANFDKMSFPELCFKLLPPTFYVNVCLYYLIMENIAPAVAELTQMRVRQYYRDWWNSRTVGEFMDKWILQINAFSGHHLRHLSGQARHCLDLTVIFIMLLSVYGGGLNHKILIFVLVSIGTAVLLLGENSPLRSNYLVHLMTIAFTPVSIAAHLKYHLFK